jgi:hypothetical protein
MAIYNGSFSREMDEMAAIAQRAVANNAGTGSVELNVGKIAPESNAQDFKATTRMADMTRVAMENLMVR